MIVIVDYGVGNLSSVANMLRKAGAEARISGDPKDILAADKLLLPGVGHFDHGMRMLRQAGIEDALNEFALISQRPVLGICLGAQILGLGSEEGREKGLGWLEMTCVRLPEDRGVRVPHMGWNTLSLSKKSPLFVNVEPDSRFYFVHSYYMQCQDQDDVAATVEHGVTFTCAVQRGSIFGTQFHPEKSLRHGLGVMRAFEAL